MKNKKKNPITIEADGQNLYLSTEGESEARAASLLPTVGSENAQLLLGKLNLPEPENYKVDRDYLPDEITEWIIAVDFEKPTILTPDQIKEEFGKQWREKYGGLTIYGFDPQKRYWTFAHSADGPETVSKLKFAWDYYSSWTDNELANEKKYAERIEGVRKSTSKFGNPIIETSLAPLEAAKQSLMLNDIHNRLNIDAIIVLQAPPGQRFDGKEIWDVMLCLGLKWGNMDIFHWDNPSDIGDDPLFSVWTSTEPGYFFLEQIAEGQVKVENLIFGYSIPRSCRPDEIHDSMFRAAEYSQKRLGGDMLDGNEKVFIKEGLSEEIKEIVAELKIAGFEPGATSTLHLF